MVLRVHGRAVVLPFCRVESSYLIQNVLTFLYTCFKTESFTHLTAARSFCVWR